ncbi:hypothetical protein BaRGS_00010483 [Batillaria attramentaria]|uniref:Uncharacterized protein n=1 Tax=Batillaria attramentaria TaxID=370345 RepID=A0ABD0LG66_9CAEN
MCSVNGAPAQTVDPHSASAGSTACVSWTGSSRRSLEQICLRDRLLTLQANKRSQSRGAEGLKKPEQLQTRARQSLPPTKFRRDEVQILPSFWT